MKYLLRKTWQHVGCVILLIVSFGLLSACAGMGAESAAGEEDAAEMDASEMEHEEGADHEDDHEHEHDEGQVQRVPNEGAIIRIISPEDGETFAAGEQVLVEVEVEGFDLAQEGNHWHVYVDGTSWGMVMGANTDQPLTGLEPGEHEIAVFLSIDTHEELEEGDAVKITVAE